MRFLEKTMFKKLLIASAVLAISITTAFADDNKVEANKSQANQANKDPANKGEAKPCPSYNPVPAPYLGLSMAARYNYSSTSRAFVGAGPIVAGGFGGVVANKWYLAGEIFVDGVIKIHDFAVTALSLQNTWDYGISFIPGYKINNSVVAYLRLGAIRTYWNEQNAYTTGGQGGIGLQTNMFDNWDFRGEYVYSYYAKTNNVSNPQTQALNVGVICRFA